MASVDPYEPAPQLAMTGPFKCDRCQDVIENTRHAWGEWYGQESATRPGKDRNWQFSITHGPSHQRHCQLLELPGVSIGHERLDTLLSADGFASLMEFFVERDVDAEELSRFLMRLYVPGYEQAHRFIDTAIAEGVFEPRSNKYFLTQSEINSIVEAHREGRFDAYL